MAFTQTHRPKNKPTAMLPRSTTLFLLSSFLLLSLTALLILPRRSDIPPLAASSSSSSSSRSSSWSGDLRDAEFSWNSLSFSAASPPPAKLRIAVFSRKWPVASAPGGMERHALTLHSVLSRRGHDVHVFTAAPPSGETLILSGAGGLTVHCLDGPPGQWKSDAAWRMFEEVEGELGGRFDVVHSESVAVFHREARGVENLVVSWHGIALEALQSGIYQDMLRPTGEPMSPGANHSLSQAIFKVLAEIRFFQSYAHQVATSDSSGEMLRDVYQVPRRRVHVILNGVDESRFGPDPELGRSFRSEIGLPAANGIIVMGAAGRLVKDKGHPILFEAFSELLRRRPDVYLVVAGTGPWAKRYEELAPNAVVIGAVPPERLKAFYNSVDLFVHPTLRPQGLDQTLLEAMQCGKPVAVTRLPSIKGSIVVDPEFGFTFAPNVAEVTEALEAAAAEGAARLAERGRACRDYALVIFTAEKMAAAYERLFLCIHNETFCMYP